MIIDRLPRTVCCLLCTINRGHTVGNADTCLLCDCPLARREWKARLGRLDPRRWLS